MHLNTSGYNQWLQHPHPVMYVQNKDMWKYYEWLLLSNDQKWFKFIRFWDKVFQFVKVLICLIWPQNIAGIPDIFHVLSEHLSPKQGICKAVTVDFLWEMLKINSNWQIFGVDILGWWVFVTSKWVLWTLDITYACWKYLFSNVSKIRYFWSSGGWFSP